ncbi:MAG: glycoside hydrolase family 13 domain protein [Gemmatimonadetes bacterium]|nr:glycoside hydrolase family 13 domain protein [Gemmatimonadota bacterium]
MHSDDELPEALRRPTALLRDLPHVRNEWRRSVQVQLDSGEPLGDHSSRRSSWRTRRWNVSAPAAIAAGLICVLAGGLAARVMPGAPRETSAMPTTIASTAQLPVRFDLIAPSATRVTIVGDFNKWNPEALPMQRSADGKRWEIEVPLPPGRYSYGFVVDGLLTRDPAAPQSASDDFGIPNSVLTVSRRRGAT